LIPRDRTVPKTNIEAGFEIASGESIITVDPRSAADDLKKHSVGTDQSRESTQTGPSDCYFCERKTPPTLFCVRRDGTVSAPTESSSFAAAVTFLQGRERGEIQTFYELVKFLAPFNRCAGSGEVVRAFVNLTPAIISAGQGNCIVVGLADHQYHGREFPDLPVEVISAFIRAFQFLEAAAEHRGLVLVPFFNSGPAAGGTVNCPHGQAYFLAEQPPLYRQIAAQREASGKCGVCEILRRTDLTIT
jgi:galactose-1-phosphate uridylyltransferase